MAATAPASTLRQRWEAAWPEALERWSRFTQLREPVFLENDDEAKAYGMQGSIAAIRLVDQLVMVNFEHVQKQGLEQLPLEVLAHEIGHHVYSPGNMTDYARTIASIMRVIPDLKGDTPHMVANLYEDLLINDRLQRRADVDVCAIYRRFKEHEPKGAPGQVWMVYTRVYEHLWRLKHETLSPEGVTDEMNTDAALIARLIRHYASNWVSGARRFATILYPYLMEDQKRRKAQRFLALGLDDTKGAGRPVSGDRQGEAIPDGLTEIDPSELGELDEFDAELEAEMEESTDGEAGGSKDRRGRGKRNPKKQSNTAPTNNRRGHKGNCREPFEYGELLKSLGMNLDQHEITARYYRERAMPHLIPFPQQKAPRSTEPLAEGFETWDAGESLENLDIFGTLVQSPLIVPGVTTVQRVYGETPGSDPAKHPIDLDIYVDSSGSMPNPAVNISYLALCGSILALSALRMGAKVQATLWSGAGQFETTGGFIRDEKRILGTIAGFISGGTAFPLNVLRETYRKRKPDETPAHIVVISDDGVDTMFAKDEHGKEGANIIKFALEQGRSGMTLALNLWSKNWAPKERFEKLGVKVHSCTTMEELVAFARAFVRENYK